MCVFIDEREEKDIRFLDCFHTHAKHKSKPNGNCDGLSID